MSLQGFRKRTPGPWEIEEKEKSGKAEIVRKLLEKGIKAWRLEKALELLAQKKATIRTAARLAGVSYREILEEASREGIDAGYSLEELAREARTQ
ncbi:MAG TPA: UPF0175 family protein [archaeon]|nr:UPF0175 family protein [archaeon]